MPSDQQWISEQRFNRLVIAGVICGFLLVLAAGAAALIAVSANQRHSAAVDHTYRVERSISQFRVLLERAETARRGMILSDDPKIAVTFRETLGQLGPSLDAIQQETMDNPVQQAVLQQMRPALRLEIELLGETARLLAGGRRAEAITNFQRTRDVGLVRSLRAFSERLLREEERLLHLRNAAQLRSASLFRLTLVITGVLLLLVGSASVWVILYYTRDLHRSRAALRALNEDLEGAVRERTTDLQRANDEIQRFAYIVSHDLRSPLVNVMGFTAELEAATKALRTFIEQAGPLDVPGANEARLAATEDLPEAIGFIRTSTQKMDRLINAILRLSREGRRPITPEQLDSDALVQAIIDSLRHRVDELGATILVQRDLPDIISDRLAVEQVLSNIIENALKYLDPSRGGRIEVTGTREGSRVIFSIADNGRGIDPRDHQRIFDLFRRSGRQDQPGEGIGLAHTRALAYRLGGTITVESELDQGATFRVNLPAVFSSEQRAIS